MLAGDQLVRGYEIDVTWRATDKLRLGADVQAFSGQYARGNENNQHQADGTYYLGSGLSGGYAVMNLGARYEVSRGVQLFGQINNLFDRQYATAAQLGSTAFSSSGGFVARPFPATGGEYPLVGSTFYAPGAPRSFWIGLRYSL